MGIAHINTTAYHPMANGATERLNRSLKNNIHFLTNDLGREDWDDQLPFALFSLNTTIHTSIQEIPFYLFHGRDCSIPYSKLLSVNNPHYRMTNFYSDEAVKRLQIAFQKVADNHEKAHQLSKLYYDRRERDPDISLGQLVFLKNENRRSLDCRFTGPYRVIALPSRFDVKIQEVNSQKTQVVHRNRLKVSRMERPFPEDVEEALESPTSTQEEEEDVGSLAPDLYTFGFIDPPQVPIQCPYNLRPRREPRRDPNYVYS